VSLCLMHRACVSCIAVQTIIGAELARLVATTIIIGVVIIRIGIRAVRSLMMLGVVANVILVLGDSRGVETHNWVGDSGFRRIRSSVGFGWIPSSPAGGNYAVLCSLYGHFYPTERDSGFGWNRSMAGFGWIRVDSWNPEPESASPDIQQS